MRVRGGYFLLSLISIQAWTLPFDLNWSVEWFSIYLINADTASVLSPYREIEPLHSSNRRGEGLSPVVSMYLMMGC